MSSSFGQLRQLRLRRRLSTVQGEHGRSPVATGAACKIVALDADCDDESGQVELRIEAQVTEAVDIRFEL